MRHGFRLSPPVFAALSLFIGISILVTSGVTLPWDEAVLGWIGSRRGEALTDTMLIASFLGDGAVAVPFALGMCVLLWRWAGRRPALGMLLAGVSGELLYVMAKAGFRRPRPAIIEQLSGAGWFSYPSGHAMLAPVLWSLALVLLARVVPEGRRWPLVLFAVVIPLTIAASRVYLGVHYPSDVLGALALGFAWMLLWLDWSSAATTSLSASTREPSSRSSE
jgi:undecaprenyl-diphosphatase